MKAWYLPSYHGDLRLEPMDNDLSRTRLTIVRPTPHEQQMLQAMEVIFRRKGWWDSPEPLCRKATRKWLQKAQEVVTCEIAAPFAELGALIVGKMKPGPSTLTAVRFESGKVLTVAADEGDLSDAMKAALALGSALDGPSSAPAPSAPAPALPPDPSPSAETALAKIEAPAPPAPPVDKPEVAASVQRPTPCCPQCVPGSVEPASEVLLSFLDEEQHESWAKDRCIKVVGGYTGVEYLLAHRHTKRAQKIGRICWSITDEQVVHFHQTEVPPEEEVLAAKLILEHREDWLRNEATFFGSGAKFKNPFGDVQDGVADAVFMERFGEILMNGWRPGNLKRRPIQAPSSVVYYPNPGLPS